MHVLVERLKVRTLEATVLRNLLHQFLRFRDVRITIPDHCESIWKPFAPNFSARLAVPLRILVQFGQI